LHPLFPRKLLFNNGDRQHTVDNYQVASSVSAEVALQPRLRDGFMGLRHVASSVSAEVALQLRQPEHYQLCFSQLHPQFQRKSLFNLTLPLPSIRPYALLHPQFQRKSLFNSTYFGERDIIIIVASSVSAQVALQQHEFLPN